LHVDRNFLPGQQYPGQGQKNDEANGCQINGSTALYAAAVHGYLKSPSAILLIVSNSHEAGIVSFLFLL
jgi:hypothetical protein